MKRAIIKFIDGEYCNLEADYMDADENYISIYLNDHLIGIFHIEHIKAAYLSDKN